jgi:hypothetical protein
LGQVQVTAWAAWTHARALDGAQYTTVLLLLLPYHAMPGVAYAATDQGRTGSVPPSICVICPRRRR